MSDSHSDAAIERLIDALDKSALAEDRKLLVLAALEGDQDLADAVSGKPVATRKRPLAEQPVHSYLERVTVTGFRGIGAKAALHLTPGPGLTLVIGRNGSGKSSFAEGIEATLTGETARWKGKTKEWLTGWKNLHSDDTPSVVVELAIDGDAGTTTVAREWLTAADETKAYVQRPGKPREEVSSLGWSQDIVTYRPFLSYAELGSALTRKPSEMHDAISSILGLDDLTAAEKRLEDYAKRCGQDMRRVAPSDATLVADLGLVDDERAPQAIQQLRSSTPDLDMLLKLAAGSAGQEPPEVADLRRSMAVQGPDIQRVHIVIDALTNAAEERDNVSESSENARGLADLLEKALAHRDRRTDDPSCPVCGTADVLDGAWHERASRESARLRVEAAHADGAIAAERTAMMQARALLTDPPSHVSGAVRSAWDGWVAGRSIASATQLAAHLRARVGPLIEALRAGYAAATERLAEIEDRWRPFATRIVAWVEATRKAAALKSQHDDLKTAHSWLRDEGQSIRNERLQPIADRSAQIWGQLRQESNVSLGPVKLAGRGTQRKVELDVTVDGAGSSALGVMSQGELHSLALSLFLPRATIGESPFRFLVIDDPVQSMDPAKVEGLARVLSEVAKDRQVIVFTHDMRLPDAVRRLNLPASMWEVVRREKSIVEVRRTSDPVTRALLDARAMLKTEDLPPEVAKRVVPGFCRSALEAAFADFARRERLKKGIPHAQVELELENAKNAYGFAALAYFGDSSKADKVLSRVNAYGTWAGNVFKAAKGGGHAAFRGDLEALVKGTEQLVKRVADVG
ncbi:AAA family ATPase [Smaragdicoccus niigatensis]|uniref:AAA family ATPase n=1 Tax=Smaragdicoccus niigatensis TaxID=359359 RepID=UPI0003A9088A|nr:AAA family ATPase [Smaragdicoccus niigatensis]